LEQILVGFLLAIIISILAFFARALSRSGAAAAVVVGTIIFGLGGLPWAVLLLAFFISSSALSHLAGRGKSILNEKAAKGSRRDAGQVLANGGVATLLVLAYRLSQGGQAFPSSPAVLAPGSILPPSAWFFAFAASLAAANADTWATELGILNKRPPVMITTGQPVDPGTSGGVSPTGTLAALGGAGLVGLLAAGLAALGSSVSNFGTHFLAISAAGLAGSLFDSLLGATWQAVYICPACQKDTERHPFHTCGSPTRLKRGWRWLNNDWVNVACTACGAILLLFVEVIR
jgi:uncharacterized protein (TIGR00297 family)